jgi:hypothetical protein
MFKIDLLKGEAIPIKSRPEGIAIGALTFTVPIIVIIVMFGLYVSNGIAMSIQKRDIAKYIKKTKALSGAVMLQKSLEREKGAIGSSLSEVASSIGKHVQWSPVLALLARHIPESMVLTSVEVKQRTETKRVPSKKDTKKMVNISVTARTLKMNICGSPDSDCDKMVRNFQDDLRFSTLLGPKLEKVKVSQEFDKLDGEDAICYTIDCIFKPGL